MIRIIARRKRRDVYSVITEHGIHVCDSKRPFFYAARALLDKAAWPGELLVMRHYGDVHDSLSAPIGWAATKTVRETDGHGPRVVKWTPNPMFTAS